MSVWMTITAVHGQKPWKDGRFVDYTVEADKLEGRHTLTQKPDTTPPAVGQQVFGHGEDQPPWPSGDPRPPKLKKDNPQGPPPTEAGGQPSIPKASNGSDPTRDSIEAQVKLKAAAEIVTAMIASGSYTPASVKDAAEKTNLLAKELSPSLERV